MYRYPQRNIRIPRMKIWLDTTLQNQHDLHAECEDDDDCPKEFSLDPYDEALQNMDQLHIESLQKYLYTCTLQQTQTLYTQAYADEYILACCPTGSGRIVLLDGEAFTLLQCFKQATTLDYVIHHFSYLSTAQIEAATGYF